MIPANPLPPPSAVSLRTRMEPQPDLWDGDIPLVYEGDNPVMVGSQLMAVTSYREIPCPFGAPGDTYWKREKFSLPPGETPEVATSRAVQGVCYWTPDGYEDGRIWQRAHTMPQWAAREVYTILSLEVVQVDGVWFWTATATKKEASNV